jgi:hypothetical protein
LNAGRDDSSETPEQAQITLLEVSDDGNQRSPVKEKPKVKQPKPVEEVTVIAPDESFLESELPELNKKIAKCEKDIQNIEKQKNLVAKNKSATRRSQQIQLKELD